MKNFVKSGLVAAGALVLSAGLLGKASAALEWHDSMSYADGDISVGSAGVWTVHGAGASNDVNIISTASDSGGSLSYAGFPASAGGRANAVGAASSDDVGRAFTSYAAPVAGSNFVYASFLLKVTGPAGASATSSAYVAHFMDAQTGSNFRGRFFIKDDGTTTGFNVGATIQAAPTAASYNAASFAYGTTHLVVIKYDLASGATNDVFSVFMNPALGGAEPAALQSAVNTAADPTDLERFCIRQDTNVLATCEIDEVRVGTTWSDVTPAAAVGPEIAVEDSGNTAIGDGGAFGYGTVVQGSGDVTEVFEVHNTGSSDLNITSVNIAGAAYAAGGDTLNAVIGAGLSDTFSVVFDADAAVGPHAGSITINSDDSDEAAYDIALSGTIAPPVVVDGDTTDALYTTIGSYTGIDGFGNHGLVQAKRYIDAGNGLLNLAIESNIEPSTFNSIVVFIGTDGATGVAAGTPLPVGDDGSIFGGIGGTVLDFEVDYALRLVQDSGNTNVYPSIIDYTAGGNNDDFMGTFTEGTTSPLINAFAGGEIAFVNAADRDAADAANTGIELSLQLADISSTASSEFRFLASYGNAGGDFWSTDTIPEIAGIAANLGNDPNFMNITGRQWAPFPTAVASPLVTSAFAQSDTEVVVRLDSAGTVTPSGNDIAVFDGTTTVFSTSVAAHGSLANSWVGTFAAPITGDAILDTATFDNGADVADTHDLYAGVMPLATLRGTVGGVNNLSSLNAAAMVTVTGTVVDNQLDDNEAGGSGRAIAIQDGTSGVTLRGASGSDLPDLVTLGGSATFTGTVGHFNGLEQVNQATAAGVGLLATGASSLPADTVIDATTATPAQLEAAESTLVQYTNVTFTGGGVNTWGTAGAEVLTGSIAGVYSDAQSTGIVGTTVPSGTGTVRGLAGQFDNLDPRDAGYQVLPFQASDLNFVSGVNDWMILNNE